MILAETLRALLRRWYIVIPGLILAVALAIGAWTLVKPGYERTATQLLLPGAQSMPENANPFLFLGGLSNAADVLVTAVGAENVLDEIDRQYPNATVEVTRDGSTPGPVILITVTGSSDDEAAAILDSMVAKTGTVLKELQADESISAADRITVVPITIDQSSTLQQRTRLIVSIGAGLAVAILAILGASLVDGFSLSSRRRGRASGGPQEDDETETRQDGDADSSRDVASTDTLSRGDFAVSVPAVAASEDDGEVDGGADESSSIDVDEAPAAGVRRGG